MKEWPEVFRQDGWLGSWVYAFGDGAVAAFQGSNWNGRTFDQIISNSIVQLNQTLGQQLLANARALCSANPPVNNIFTDADMVRMLVDAKYSYGGWPPVPPDVLAIPMYPVVFRHAEPGTAVTTSGYAIVGGHEIWINPASFINAANAFSALFTNNQVGQTRMEVIVGKTILHEVIHTQGFDHPNHPGTTYNPSDPYWRTLPETAEQAYFLIHSALFPGFGTIHNISGPTASMQCGCGDFLTKLLRTKSCTQVADQVP